MVETETIERLKSPAEEWAEICHDVDFDKANGIAWRSDDDSQFRLIFQVEGVVVGGTGPDSPNDASLLSIENLLTELEPSEPDENGVRWEQWKEEGGQLISLYVLDAETKQTRYWLSAHIERTEVKDADGLITEITYNLDNILD